jgi:hypothetical protein
VHSVLTGEKTAPKAAAALQNDLVHITGFRTGRPPGGVTSGTAKGTSDSVN